MATLAMADKKYLNHIHFSPYILVFLWEIICFISLCYTELHILQFSENNIIIISMVTFPFHIQFYTVGKLFLLVTDSMHAFYYANVYSSEMYPNPFLTPFVTHSYHQTYIQ